MERLPEGVGGIGDSAYQGIAKLHPDGLGASPHKKPKGKPRSEEDKAYNSAFSSRRIIVENTIAATRVLPKPTAIIVKFIPLAW